MRSPKPADNAYRTIFHEILNSKLPPKEKTITRLGDEAMATVAGEIFQATYF